jgi:hypothetical protein
MFIIGGHAAASGLDPRPFSSDDSPSLLAAEDAHPPAKNLL